MRITWITLAAVFLASLCPGFEAAVPRSEVGSLLPGDRLTDPSGSGWQCKRSDNVCGLDDPLQLSNPAKLDYDACLKETPSWKKMEKDGVDPDSPEGIRLRNAAADELKKAAEKVMKEKGHCSVWKKITHKDGREVTDLTEEILGEL